MTNQSVFSQKLSDKIRRAGVVAVLVIDDACDAVPLAQSLIDGGVGAIELTLRTDAALESLRRIRSEVPEMIVGIGTAITPQQIRQVADMGASFAVAPGTNPSVIQAARDSQLPFAPGICTPSDIEAAVQAGCRLLKFYPAQAVGGLGFLKTIHTPYAHLGLEYVPLGGINLKNASEYLESSLVHSIGGSWIAPRDLIRSKDWRAIRSNAQQAMEMVQAARPGIRHE